MFIENSMGLWKNIWNKLETSAQIIFKCAIYQGDLLFPLLFAIDLNIISQITTRIRYGYRAGLSAIFFTWITPSYEKSERNFDSLAHPTWICSKDIGIVDYRNIVWKVVKRKEIVMINAVDLPSGYTMLTITTLHPTVTWGGKEDCNI